MKRILSVCFSALACLLLLGGCADTGMQTVRERMIDQNINPLHTPAYQQYKLAQLRDGQPVDSLAWLQEVVGKLDKGVRENLESQLPDGSWEDIVYECHMRSAWRAATHLSRMENMAKAYCTEASSFYQDENLLQAALKAADFWLERRPKSVNWWSNEIGAPRTMGVFTLLLEDKLSEEQFAGLIDRMNISKIKISGQNKIWLCYNVMTRAVLTKDQALFEEAVREMKSVIKVENDEGVQFDWSFHQHGRQQQFGNYGLSYLGSLAQMGRLFQGTRYGYNEEQLSILRHYALDGMSWVIWKGEMETGSCGRQIFFPDAMKSKATTYGLQLLELAKLDPTHAEEYTRMFDGQMLGGENPLQGIKHFFKSDMTFMRTDDWMAALKMCSDRTVGAEAVNGENPQCQVFSNGSLMIYQDGGEYNNIYPIWDWTRIPGVTCNFKSHFDFPQEDRRVKGRAEIVGGLVGDGWALSEMQVDADGLKANKSWYFTPEYILCLGSEIESVGGNEVVTGVNQTFKNGEATLLQTGSSTFVPRAAAQGRDIQAVLHGGVGYFFPYQQQVSYTLGTQKGSWNVVRHDSPDTLVTGEVFNLALHHGRDPKAGNYSYVVVPRTDEKKLSALMAAPGFEILKQTDGVHAVRFDDGSVRCVFFAPGATLKVDDKIEILNVVEEMIMSFRREGNTVYVTYADGTGEKDSTIITFRGHWTGDNSYYDPERNVSVLEFDSKISHGKRLDTVCQIVE